MHIALADGVTLAETDYGTVLLDGRRGSYWQLNETGTRIARTLIGGGTREHAAEVLCTEFSVDVTRALRDVDVLVQELLAAGVVQETAG